MNPRPLAEENEPVTQKPSPRSGEAHGSGLTLLPCAAGVCQQCAKDHPAEQPHNQQSLYWQYYFYGKNGRWPTWADAMAHCTSEVRAHWTTELAKHGITVPNA